MIVDRRSRRSAELGIRSSRAVVSIVAGALMALTAIPACRNAEPPAFIPPRLLFELPSDARPIRTRLQLAGLGFVDALGSGDAPLDLRRFYAARKERTAPIYEGAPNLDGRYVDGGAQRYSPLSGSLLIVVDTSMTVPIRDSHIGHELLGDSLWIAGGGADTAITVAAGMPVYLVDTGRMATRLLVQDGRLPMIVEARDGDGGWRPIEYWRMASCAHPYMSMVLRPREYCLTRVYRYTGRVRTELRIRLMGPDREIITSLPFKGSIDPGQFAPIITLPRLSGYLAPRHETARMR